MWNKNYVNKFKKIRINEMRYLVKNNVKCNKYILEI